MFFSTQSMLASLFIAGGALGSMLQIIDDAGDCKIWSSDNYGCTGNSFPFAKLDGDDCSDIGSKNYTDLAVDICGTVGDKWVASVRVLDTAEVIFKNLQGNQATCTLNGFKPGDHCFPSAVSTSSPSSSTTSSSPDSSDSSTVTDATSSSPTTTPTDTTTSSPSVASTCACH